MFHRRAADYFRKRDWAGMGFELIVVALGVLLGIEASNWNERRVRADRQQQVMAQLAHELDLTVREARQRVDNAGQVLSGTFLARQVVDSGRLDPREAPQFERGMCSTLSFWQPAWRLGIVDQLISSGDLDLIGDPQLRSGLVAYRDTVSVLRSDITGLGQNAVARLAPVDRYVDYAYVQPELKGGGSTEAEIISQVGPGCRTDLAGFHADREARDAIKFMVGRQATIYANQKVVLNEALRLQSLLRATSAR